MRNSTVLMQGDCQELNDELVRLYHQDIWNPNFGQGLYFSAMEELGFPINIVMAVNEEWISTPHAVYDGLSLLKLLDNKYQLGLKLELNSKYTPKNFFGWIRGILSSLTSRPVERFKPQTYDLSTADENSKKFILIKKSGITNNSELLPTTLNIVNRVLAEKVHNNQITRWMIPVNIRTHFTKAQLGYMNASYFGINCNKDESPQQTKIQIRSKLKSNEYWGYWIVTRIGLLFGKDFIVSATKKSISKKNATWFGSFSYLGNIGGNGQKELIVLHPVRLQRPVGCILYAYNGDLHLTVSVDQSLKIPDSTLQEIADDIQRRLDSSFH